MRAMTIPIIIVLCAAACAGCSSSGGSSTTTATKASAASGATAQAPSSSPQKITATASASADGIAISGAFTASVSVNLCSAGGASITVHVKGDSGSYLGVISSKAFAFVGPGAADYSLEAGQYKPTASAGDMSFTVKDAKLTDLVSGKTITATGTVSCP